jgi:hypothetical protein
VQETPSSSYSLGSGTPIQWVPCIISHRVNLPRHEAYYSFPSNAEVFLIGIVGGGVQLGPLDTALTNRPIVPAPGDYSDGEIGGMIGRGNRSTSRKPAQCRFVHHKPHMLPGANPGRRGGKPATNRLSYGTA